MSLLTTASDVTVNVTGVGFSLSDAGHQEKLYRGLKRMVCRLRSTTAAVVIAFGSPSLL
jgi:hypothetical protein